MPSPLGINTYVSNPGYPDESGQAADDNGASAVGSNMQVAHGVLLIIGSALAGLYALGYLTSKSSKK